MQIVITLTDKHHQSARQVCDDIRSAIRLHDDSTIQVAPTKGNDREFTITGVQVFYTSTVFQDMYSIADYNDNYTHITKSIVHEFEVK